MIRVQIMLYTSQKKPVTAIGYFQANDIPVAEGMPNLSRARRSNILVKIGGDCLTNGGYNSIGQSLADLYMLGVIPTVVHGGGSQIDEMMKQAGIPIKKVNGLRVVPDQETLDCVLKGLGKTNERLVSAINTYNGHMAAAGLTGEGVVYAKKMEPQLDKATGKKV